MVQVLTKEFRFKLVGDNQPFGRLNSRASQPDLCFINILATAWIEGRVTGVGDTVKVAIGPWKDGGGLYQDSCLGDGME